MKCPKCHAENIADSHFCIKCATPLPPSKPILEKSSEDVGFDQRTGQPPLDISVFQTKTLEIPINSLSIGSTFARRYEVLDGLGQGGMGEVYKVLDKELDEEVALKLLRPEIALDQRTIERFRNEIKLARRITHKNVCRMHDLGKEGATHYITMEYVRGEDLKSIIRRTGKIRIGQAAAIVMQVCDGLAEAHRLGIIHRDLKPQNIMIDEEGVAKIMDFGIARTLEGRGVTAEGFIVGTPDYISPEQVDGGGVDQRADIYALGVIFYEMLTGRLPFEGDTAFSVAMKHKGEAPVDPRKFCPRIPDDLSGLILRCLEKDRDKRYQTAEELLNLLIEVEKSLPEKERVAAKIVPRLAWHKEDKYRFKKILIPALIVMATVVIGIGLWRLFLSRRTPGFSVPADRPRVAIMPFKNNTGDENLDYYREVLQDSMISDLSQSKYITVLPNEDILLILKRLGQLEAKSYSSDVLEKIAREGFVNHLILGSYAASGGTLRVIVNIQKVGEKRIFASEKIEGRLGDCFPLIDELTPTIKRHLNLTPEAIRGDLDREIGEITSKSERALQLFREGWKQGVINNDFQKGIENLEKAITLDPEFALAYRQLGAYYGNLGEGKKSIENVRIAYKLAESGHVSERERLIIQAGNEWTYGNFFKAIETWNRIFESYPDDTFINTKLAQYYLHPFMEYDNVIEHAGRSIRNRTESFFPYSYLQHVFYLKGQYEKSRDINEYYIDTFRDRDDLHYNIAQTFIAEGKFKQAFKELEKAYQLNPDDQFYSMRGRAFLFKGDLNAAEMEFKKLLEKENKAAQFSARAGLSALYRLQGRFMEAGEQLRLGIELAREQKNKSREGAFHQMLAQLYLSEGRLEEALEECGQAPPGWENVMIKAMKKAIILAKMKSFDEALKAAMEVKESWEKYLNGLDMRRPLAQYQLPMAVIELEKRNYDKAIEYCSQYKPWMPQNHGDYACYIEPLARAYNESGDLARASAEYELISSLLDGREYYGETYARSFYTLGKIYEQTGRKSKAAEDYKKFIELWKNCDAQFQPLVQDAKTRLAGLGR